ncbi:MAG: hypothetical protein J6N47_07490 [Lachnospiraceae bacterium]|nr:hypothetical protein [Lachnospiraceae bacterium]
MGRLSDRDATIIMILLVIAIVAFPYVFYIKDAKVDTEALKQEYVTLEARYNELQEMDKHREEFLKRTDELNNETEAIVASYPADIRQENYTQFLLDTELNHDLTTANFDKDTRRVTWDEGAQIVLFDTISYSENDEVPIQSDEISTPYTSVINQSTITYSTYYVGMKNLLSYFIDQQTCPMCYRGFTADYDEATGVVTGSFVIEQYAIKNTNDPDRVLAPVEIFPNIDAYDIRGMAYDYGTNGINGNNGVFGPLVLDEELSEEGVEAKNDALEDGAPAEAAAEEAPAEEAPAENN